MRTRLWENICLAISDVCYSCVHAFFAAVAAIQWLNFHEIDNHPEGNHIVVEADKEA